MKLLYWGIVIIFIGIILFGIQILSGFAYQFITLLGVMLILIGGIIALVPGLLLKPKFQF